VQPTVRKIAEIMGFSRAREPLVPQWRFLEQVENFEIIRGLPKRRWERAIAALLHAISRAQQALSAKLLHEPGFPAFGEPSMTISPVYLRRDKARSTSATHGPALLHEMVGQARCCRRRPIFRKLDARRSIPDGLDTWAQSRIGAPQKSTSERKAS